MAATDETIARCVAHYRHLVNSRSQPPDSLSQAPDSRLHVILERAGVKRRSEPLLARLDTAFTDAGLKTFPALTDPGLESDDRVWIFDAKHVIDGLTPNRQLFHNEAALESFILANQGELKELRGLGLSGFEKQAILDSGRRVDILCKRSRLNQLVGIELKLREPDDRATGQLQQYFDDLDQHANNHGYDSAHLILIAGQPDKSVRNRVQSYAATRGLTVAFLLYKVHMDLDPHP